VILDLCDLPYIAAALISMIGGGRSLLLYSSKNVQVEIVSIEIDWKDLKNNNNIL
jgi:hypothetical protein